MIFYTYLFLSITSSVFIANIIHVINNKKLSIFNIMLINYIIAFLLTIPFIDKTPDNTVIFLGIINGILFFLGFIAYFFSVRYVNISMAVTIMRISVLIPTLFGVIYIKEHLNIYKTIGIMLLLLAIFNLTNFTIKKHNIKTFFVLLLLFFTCGFADVISKIFQEISNSSIFVFLFVIYFSSFIINLLFLLLKNSMNLCLETVVFGIILGVPNFLTVYFMLKSLIGIPSVIVFPTIALGILILSILSDWIIWKKQFKNEEFIALILASVSLLFINW